MLIAMIVGLVTFELHLPHARSLKDKRRVVRSVVERIHQRCRVSVLESGCHDLHQRAEITVALLAAADAELDRRLEGIRQIVDGQSEALVGIWNERVLEAIS